MPALLVWHGRQLWTDAQAPPLRASLAGVDLSSANLVGANFTHVDLTGANLQGADLRGATFRFTNLKSAELNDAIMDGVSLGEGVAGLSGDQLRGVRGLANVAVLQRAKMSGIRLAGMNLLGAHLARVDLSGADLHEADLHEADLHEADLHEADLRGANLHHANLRGADLSGADLSGADLSGADLRGADLSGAKLVEADLSLSMLFAVTGLGADLSRADLTGATLAPDPPAPGAVPRGSEAIVASWSTNLASAVLTDVRLTGAKIQSVSFNGANLSYADFASAQIEGVSFKEANLSYADFAGAQLLDWEPYGRLEIRTPGDMLKKYPRWGNAFEESILTLADFSTANLSGARFRDVHWEEAPSRSKAPRLPEGHPQLEGTGLVNEDPGDSNS